MEFDDFGDLFGDEVLEMEEKDVEKDEIEQEKSTQKAKDLENVWEKQKKKQIQKKIMPQPRLSERELTALRKATTSSRSASRWLLQMLGPLRLQAQVQQ
uniref:Uncharacterized protein n=1 Tax=Meloidogyne enterolobii TaxID=390850 RepID=A0A6V7X2C3_MELEN|nr:unnamed protein product [Meloidogyne enterolobii]